MSEQAKRLAWGLSQPASNEGIRLPVAIAAKIKVCAGSRSEDVESVRWFGTRNQLVNAAMSLEEDSRNSSDGLTAGTPPFPPLLQTSASDLPSSIPQPDAPQSLGVGNAQNSHEASNPSTTNRQTNRQTKPTNLQTDRHACSQGSREFRNRKSCITKLYAHHVPALPRAKVKL